MIEELKTAYEGTKYTVLMLLGCVITTAGILLWAYLFKLLINLFA